MDAFKILEKYRIPIAPYILTKSLKKSLLFAEKVGFPVVVKAFDKRIIHKSDVGAVILDIWNIEMLKNSIDYIKKKFNPKQIMIQKQIKKGIEIYIGIKNDENFGNVILLGIGGIYVEVFRDISARICPITYDDVTEMINELKARKIFLGYRGEPINLKKLAYIMEKLCIMAKKEKIKEMDINPLKAHKDEFFVVDARVVK